MRQAGAFTGASAGASYRMTIGALLALKQPRALDGDSGRLGRRLHLALHPSLEVRFGVGDHAKAHPGMLDAAKFRTHARIDPGRVRLQPNVAPAPGYCVHLA